MKEDDFNNLIKSIKQAGTIQNGQLSLAEHLSSIFGNATGTKYIDQVRRVQDTASDKIVWILSRRLQLSAHLGKVFFRTHFLQGLFTRYPISKSYLNLKFFFIIRLKLF